MRNIENLQLNEMSESERAEFKKQLEALKAEIENDFQEAVANLSK